MAFERIKIIKGHEYRYRVKSVRKNGKVRQEIVEYLGRVDKDKEQVSTGEFTIPYGLYYFAQEGCGSCMDEEELRERIELYMRRVGVTMPAIHYVNLSKMANPTGIVIVQTPTLVECDEGKLFVADSGSLPLYIQYKIGEKRFRKISRALEREDKQARTDELRNGVCAGKTFDELFLMGYGTREINACREKIRKEKAEGCKDGVCALPQSSA